MDLKQYFRKVRQIEAGLSERFPLVTSLETPDGGKAGLVSEISREQSSYTYLESRGCASIEMGELDLLRIFYSSYGGLFSNGFDRQMLELLVEVFPKPGRHAIRRIPVLGILQAGRRFGLNDVDHHDRAGDF